MSNQPRNVRRTLLQIFRALRLERNALLDTIAKQRVVMLEQAALIRKQDAAMREMADSLASVRAMAVRYCEFVKADETKRPAEGSPLQ